MAYSFEQLLAADPANPSNVAQNAAITIFAPGDPTQTPLTITDPSGGPLANPIMVNANGFGSAFMHETLDRVAWAGGGFTAFVTSYEGMKAEAVAARTAAETAQAEASTAGANAASEAATALAGAVADAEAAATAAAQSASLVGAPADAAIAAAVTGSGTATKTALSATFAPTSGSASYAGVAKTIGGGTLPKPLRVPVLNATDLFPTTRNDYRLVWAQGDTVYGVSKSNSVHKSTDGAKSWTFLGTNSVAPAYRGAWLKLASGNHITLLNSSPLQIGRSTNDGGTFTSVFTLAAGELTLTSQSWAQDQVTGYIYLGVYQTTDAFTGIRLFRSTDDGATWTDWYTFPGIAGTDPQKIRHIHGVQYDPISQRVYVMTGDNEPAAGIYRVTADGTTLEKVITKATAIHADGTPSGNDARSIGLMWFPDYLVWATDSQPLGYIVRMHRNQIGVANPVVERVYQLNSSGWGSIRASSDNTEWICFSSGESSPATPIDRNAHAYWVTDNGATVYELGSMSSQSASVTPTFHPVGQAYLHDGQSMWFQSKDFFPEVFFRASLSKSTTQIAQPAHGPRVYAWESAGSGPQTIPAGVNTNTVFHRARVPLSATTLYVHDAEIRTWAGTGTAPRVQVIRVDNSAVLVDTSGSIRVGSARREADEFVTKVTGLPADVDLEFRIQSKDAANAFTGAARVVFGFGY